MKKLLIILAAFTLLMPVTKAQLWRLRRYEVSGGIGTTQFFGDIGGFSNDKNILGIKDFSFRQTRFNINGNLRYRILENVSVRVNLVAGLFHSTDARGENVNRGFQSNTIFCEPSLLGEYYFIKNREENSFIFLERNETLLKSVFASLDFYVFTGIGGLVYHVKPNDILAPNVTKPDGFTGVVPLGIGASIIYSERINIGVELGGRFTFTDNLDGYTSVHSKANDIFHLLNFTFTYKLRKGNSGHTSIGN
jgi:hypothetical protein